MKLSERRIDPQTDTNLYPLLDFISQCYHSKQYNGFPVVKTIRHLTRLIDEYKFALETVIVDGGSYLRNSECLSLSQDLPNNLGHFNLIWDIEKAKDLIKRKRLKVRVVPLQDISYSVPFGSLGIVSNEPPILTQYEPNEGTERHLLCLDGNHRLHQASLTGTKKIKAYVLNPKQSMSCLINDKYRIVYKILVNINRMAHYMIGLLDEKQFKLYEVEA